MLAQLDLLSIAAAAGVEGDAQLRGDDGAGEDDDTLGGGGEVLPEDDAPVEAALPQRLCKDHIGVGE